MSSNKEIKGNLADSQVNTQPGVFESTHFWRILFININAAICSFLYGQQVTDLNMIEATFFQLNDVGSKADVFVGLFNAMLAVGCLIGTISFGFFSFKFGRFQSFFMFNGFGIVGTSIMCINNEQAFIFGRLLCGVAVGIGSSLAPLYIVEMTPTNLQTQFGGFVGLFIGFGLVFSCALAFPIPGVKDYEVATPFLKNQWRFLMLIPIVFHLLNMIVLLFCFNFETPFYYAFFNKNDEAKQILKQIQKEQQVEEKSRSLQAFVNKKKEKNKNINYLTLFSQDYRKQMILIIIWTFLICFSGISIIGFYSKRVIIGISDSKLWTPSQEKNATIYSIFINLTGPIGTILSSIFRNRIGRRTWLILGFSLLLVINIVFSILNWKQFQVPWILFLSSLCNGMFLAPILYLYMAEMLPDVGVALGAGFQWMFTIFFSLLFPVLDGVIKIEGVFGFVAGIDALGILFGLFLMVETYGKSKEEIEAIFKKNKKKEDNEEVEAIKGKNEAPIKLKEDVSPIAVQLKQEIPLEIPNEYRP